MDELKEVAKDTKGEHVFHIYNWDSDGNWVDKLIEKFTPLVREYYTAFSELEKDLKKLVDEESGFTVDQMKECLQECLKASIPSTEEDEKPKQLKTYRSDFPEILASLCLQELFNTTIPVNGIKKKELTELPSRGIDILGYEEKQGKIHLIICEVKGSTSVKSPPDCIMGSADSAEQQLLSCITNRRKTLNRLNAIYSKCPDDKKATFAKILLLWQQEMHQDLKIILCPFLVREKSKYNKKDYMGIKKKVKQFSPAVIRFIIVCINEDLTEISKKLYSFAPNLEVKHDD